MKKFSIFNFRFSNLKGMTLIELLVVVAILGILSALLFAAVDPVVQFEKARDARRKSDLVQIQKALEQYYQDNGGHYPLSTGSGSYQIMIGNSGLNWGSPWLPYMNILPSDPKTPQRTYQYVSNGQSYYLYVSLERGSADPSVCNNGNLCVNAPSGPTGVNCGTNTVCNYGVTSTNVSP